jgi:glycosyltransferase involved in cell wall biosynthesis
MFTIGGAETMLVDIINRQVEFAEVALCIINDKIDYSLLEKLDKRVNKILIKRKEKSINPFHFIRLNCEINRFRPDVIHSHQDIIAMVLPFVTAPKILTVHDIGFNLKYIKKYKIICSISKAVQKDLDTRLNLGSVLVYNGIDMDSIKKKELLTKRQNTFRLLQISRLIHEKKGQDILIRAIHRLKQELLDINISLDLIGTGPSQDYLLELCKELRLENNVNFLGEKDRNDIYKSIAGYDLLVQPSRYEGFGLTVIEGLAAKIPVLSSENDGPEEILQSGKFGFLFKNGSMEDCAKQLKEIYTGYDSLNPMIEEGYKYIKEHFHIDRTAQKYLDICKSIKNNKLTLE